MLPHDASIIVVATAKSGSENLLAVERLRVVMDVMTMSPSLRLSSVKPPA
jgi:hypothetical protein